VDIPMNSELCPNWNTGIIACPPWCDSSVECSTTDKSGLGQGAMEYWLKASLKLKVPGVS